MSASDPTSFNNPASQIFGPEQIDNVARAVLTLTREVVVLTDRVMVLDEILGQKGVDVSDAVDSYQPSEEFQERANGAMQTITRDVLDALQGADGG